MGVDNIIITRTAVCRKYPGTIMNSCVAIQVQNEMDALETSMNLPEK